MRKRAVLLRSLVCIVVLAIAVLFFTKGYLYSGEFAEKPHIVLISIDTLRADRLGGYGYSLNTSPVIDKLAARGVLFENAFASRGETWPALTSIMTSKYPHQHGVRMNGIRYEENLKTLAGELKESGYTTAGFISNAVSARWDSFDFFEGLGGYDQSLRDSEITEIAVDWIREYSKKNRIFVWIHYNLPHYPYTEHAGFTEQFVDPNYAGSVDGSEELLKQVFEEQRNLAPEDLARIQALYDAEIALVDSNVGRVWSAIKSSGVEDNTLIVLTADHGEELHEHNKYFFHSASVYDSVLHVPLIFTLPGVVNSNRKVDGVVEEIDIAPTILDLVGIEIPEDFVGRSLKSVLLGADLTAETAAFSEYLDNMVSVRTSRYRFLLNPTGRGTAENYPIAKMELYDLEETGKEEVNIVDVNPTVAKQLNDRITQWVQQQGWKSGSGDGQERFRNEIDHEALDELKSLGYL